MARRGVISMAAVLAFVVVLCVGGAVGQTNECTTALVSLSPCLNYITGNDSRPSSMCCSQLASVVQSKPQCLCAVLNGGGSSYGITINQTQALALPTACNVQTPPVSKCNTSGAPTGSPSTQTPSAPAGGGGGSKTLPSSDNSGGSYAAAPASVIISALLAVAYFTF